MKAMILAAGRGARLSPLTDTTPKPLLKVAGKTLIDWQLDRLCAAGFTEFVVNLGYLGEQIRDHLNRHTRPGIDIQFSIEPPSALETGGGIVQALPMLGPGCFAVVNADVWSDFDFTRLRHLAATAQSEHWRGHLILVPNPDHNPDGDFGLYNGFVKDQTNQRFTFTGLSILDSRLFETLKPGRFPLAPILTKAATRNALTGELHFGKWSDIGTIERLREINDINLAIEDETEI